MLQVKICENGVEYYRMPCTKSPFSTKAVNKCLTDFIRWCMSVASWRAAGYVVESFISEAA